MSASGSMWRLRTAHPLCLWAWLWPLLVGCLLETHAARRQGYSIRIAGVFEESDPPALLDAFRSAVDAINRQSRADAILGRLDRRPLLDAQELVVTAADSFGTGRKICNLTLEGVAGVVGPRQSTSTDIVRSICDRLEIPQIVTNWDPQPPPARLYQFNLHPDADFIAQALVDVLRELKWRSYTVLYQGDESLMRLRGVLQERERSDPPIAVRQLDESGDHSTWSSSRSRSRAKFKKMNHHMPRVHFSTLGRFQNEQDTMKPHVRQTDLYSMKAHIQQRESTQR